MADPAQDKGTRCLAGREWKGQGGFDVRRDAPGSQKVTRKRAREKRILRDHAVAIVCSYPDDGDDQRFS